MLKVPTIKSRSAKFRDREDAGRQLAELLAGCAWTDPLVLALPKGGIQVGHQIAQRLKAPMEVFLVRKLRAPRKEAAHFGALSECGTAVMNDAEISTQGLSMEEIDECLQEAAHTLERRLMFFRRADHRLPSLAGRSVILADDVADGGWSLLAALSRIHSEKPHELALAVPVFGEEARKHLEGKVDKIYSLARPEHVGPLERWFGDAGRVSDEDVLRLLSRHGEQFPRTAKNGRAGH